MKNFRSVLITLLAVAVAGLIAVTIYTQGEKQRDQAMVGFVTQSISDITGTWNPAALEKRADPAFIKAVNASGKSLGDFFNKLSALGASKNDIACNRLRYADITDASGRYASADFVCKATFEHGPAIIVLQIKQSSLRGPWRITLFRVDSPLFAKKKVSQ